LLVFSYGWSNGFSRALREPAQTRLKPLLQQDRYSSDKQPQRTQSPEESKRIYFQLNISFRSSLCVLYGCLKNHFIETVCIDTRSDIELFSSRQQYADENWLARSNLPGLVG
jgi:hypothetical protein